LRIQFVVRRRGLKAGRKVSGRAKDKKCAVLRKIRGAEFTEMAVIPIMKIQDVMTKGVHTCRADTNLAMAAMQMWEGDFGALPVVDDGGKVVGMITDRDICMGTASKNEAPGKIRVGEIMSGEVYSCSADDDIREALKTMQQRRVRRLPVTDDGKIAGLLSLNDLALKARSSAHADLSAQDVEDTLKEICAHPTFALGRPFKDFGRKAAAAVV